MLVRVETAQQSLFDASGVNKHVVLRSSLDDLLPEFCEWYAFLQFKCKCHAITDASVAER